MLHVTRCTLLSTKVLAKPFPNSKRPSQTIEIAGLLMPVGRFVLGQSYIHWYLSSFAPASILIIPLNYHSSASLKLSSRFPCWLQQQSLSNASRAGLPIIPLHRLFGEERHEMTLRPHLISSICPNMQVDFLAIDVNLVFAKYNRQ